jgi:hypothetical protein
MRAVPHIFAGALPKFIEVGAHVLNGWSKKENIPITEVVLVIKIKVFISHVTTAGYSGQAVKNSRLVMHALIDTAESQDGIYDSAKQRGAYGVFRVVNSYIDVGVCGKQQQRLVFGVNQKIVNQNPDPYSAIGRAQQHFSREYPDIVSAPYKILDIYCCVGMLRQPGPPHQRFLALFEDINTGSFSHERFTRLAVNSNPVL